MKKLSSLVVAVGLTLTGCSAQPAAESTDRSISAPTSATALTTEALGPEAEPSSEAGTDDQFAFATGMTFGKFTVPGESDKGFTSIMKRYDDDLDNLTYLNVLVDNRDGNDTIRIGEVRIYDEEGNESMYVSPLLFLDKMYEIDESKMDYESEYMKYFDEFNEGVSMGKKTTATLISLDKMPEKISRIIVKSNLGEVEAWTLKDARDQGYPMDF